MIGQASRRQHRIDHAFGSKLIAFSYLWQGVVFGSSLAGLEATIAASLHLVQRGESDDGR